MAENGVKTTTLVPTAVIDDIVANKAGSTVAIPFADFAQQLISDGAVADKLTNVSGFGTVALLKSDAVMSYAAGAGLKVMNVGQDLRVNLHRYQVAASAATDHHITTAGGLKLYVLSGFRGFNALAFGLEETASAAANTVVLQMFFDACEMGEGHIPKGSYDFIGPLNLDPQMSYNISGETWDGNGATGTSLWNRDVTGKHGIVVDNGDPYVQNWDRQIRLVNMTIKGNDLSGNGIDVDHAQVHLDSLWSVGHGGHGIRMLRAYSSALRQVFCVQNFKNGLSIEIAGNLIHLDHCTFNANARLPGYAGLYLNGLPGDGRNFSVVATSCDTTGNGGALTGLEVAYGVVVQNSAGVMLNGHYAENNRGYNLYADGSVSGLNVSCGTWQGAEVFLDKIDGLIWEGNELVDTGSLTTKLTINAGMDTGRFPHRIFGTKYMGTVTKTLTGGATEVEDFKSDAAPTAGDWLKGDMVRNVAANEGGDVTGWTCIASGTPGTWRTDGVLPGVLGDHGDVSKTLQIGVGSFPTNLWRSPLTADRTVTLSATDAYSGAKFRIARATSSTGAFNLNVASFPAKALAAGEWCDVEYDGASWHVTACGSL